MEMICIRCPMGCRLSVVEQDGALQVANYSCRRGLEYGLSEFRNPQRVVTATVPTDGDPAWLPVRSPAREWILRMRCATRLSSACLETRG